MAKIYSTEIHIHATAYIKAGSEEEADRILHQRLCNQFVEASGPDFDDRQYEALANDADYYVSFSPAATVASYEELEQPIQFDEVYPNG